MSVTDTATVTTDEVVEITRDVWGSFLSLDLVPVEPEAPPMEGVTLTGVVHISGGWEGSVLVQLPAAHAQAAAEAMFAAAPGSLSEDEVSDALGELTNMVGGNIKGLLPGPNTLSLPSVTSGESYSLRVPGAVPVERVRLLGPAGPVRVSVWRS